MKKLSELVKEVNRNNAPPDGWKKEDILKGSVICKAKKCDNYLYKNTKHTQHLSLIHI